jgi:hypothetical protein
MRLKRARDLRRTVSDDVRIGRARECIAGLRQTYGGRILKPVAAKAIKPPAPIPAKARSTR